MANEGADWPLSRKFGTSDGEARELMLRAGEMGLDPYGLSFHVGSQQTTTRAYEVAIGKVAMLFTDLTEAGVNLRMMNLGGGFPTRYREPVPEIDEFGDAIMDVDDRAFRQRAAGDADRAGPLHCRRRRLVSAEVVLVSRRDRERSGALGVSRHRSLRRTGGDRGRGDQVSHHHAA